MTAPVEVPEVIRQAVAGQRHFIDSYTCPEEYDHYEAHLMALIAAALVSAKREAIREAVERLPNYGNDLDCVIYRTASTGRLVHQVIDRAGLLAALLPPEAP